MPLDGKKDSRQKQHPWVTALVVATLIFVTAAIYVPGIGGGFIFDDYPNIVDNHLVQPTNGSMPQIVAAALSSPSSDLKRPLSSLSFAADFLASGLNAESMKITNICIHILNGIVLFLFLRALLTFLWPREAATCAVLASGAMTLSWLVLPINLSVVLYVVQRMESLANLFVLIGLLGFLHSRVRLFYGRGGFLASIFWTVIPTAFGVLAKETAVLLPLYVFFLELFVFRFRAGSDHSRPSINIIAFHGIVLGAPLIVGSILLGPALLDPRNWSTRDFTLHTRLLSEFRVLVDYIQWTLLPRPGDLSFYHDDFVQSTGWLSPATTLTSAIALLALIGIAWAVRRRTPLISLGIAWFIGCHTLTGTVLPLELVYEHRNYFASIGLILALSGGAVFASEYVRKRLPTSRVGRYSPAILCIALFSWSTLITATTAERWGNPMTLAEELATRAPDSPRAQYELGRAYIIASHYRANSPYADKSYAPLERAAKLEGSSILPQQALIFLNSRMERPIKEEWWTSMVAKLSARSPTVQDESSLDALARCLGEQGCHFDPARLNEAMNAALAHTPTTGRLLAIAASFARRSLRDEGRAYSLQTRAVMAAPNEPVYRLTLAQMALDRGDQKVLHEQLEKLDQLNVGGRLDSQLTLLRVGSSSRL